MNNFSFDDCEKLFSEKFRLFLVPERNSSSMVGYFSGLVLGSGKRPGSPSMSFLRDLTLKIAFLLALVGDGETTASLSAPVILTDETHVTFCLLPICEI